MKTEDVILDEIDILNEFVDQGRSVNSGTFEEGAMWALLWILGDTSEPPSEGS